MTFYSSIPATSPAKERSPVVPPNLIAALLGVGLAVPPVVVAPGAPGAPGVPVAPAGALPEGELLLPIAAAYKLRLINYIWKAKKKRIYTWKAGKVLFALGLTAKTIPCSQCLH